MRASIAVLVLWVASAQADPPVHFEGNHEIATDELEQLAQRPEGRLALQVTALYYDRGFMRVQVDPPIVEPDGALLLRIHEGARYRVGRIRFIGLQRPGDLETRTGEVLSRSRIMSDLERLKSMTQAPVKVRTVIDDARRTVDLVFEASL